MTVRRGPVARAVLTRETALGALLVILAMAACAALGLWQLSRHEGRVEMRDVILANYDAEPIPFESVLPEPRSPLSGSDQWRTTVLEGEYCVSEDCVLYVRNRPQGGDVGFWQLVPFTTADRTVLVVRGWVPIQSAQSLPAEEPPVPAGEQEIVVRLRPVEPVLAQREDPPGQVQSVSPERAALQLPDDLPPLQGHAYGELVSEQFTAEEMPEPLPRPDTDLGPHLSYAFQWWIFALFFPAALVVRTRRLILEEREDAASTSSASPGRESDDPRGAEDPRYRSGPRARDGTPRRDAQGRARRRNDEEEEDALLDD